MAPVQTETMMTRASDLPAIAGGLPIRTKDLPYSHHCVGEAEEREVLDTLRHGWLTAGPKTVAFEQAFAEWIGARFAIAVSNASAALHLSLLALQLGPGDEVITTPLTFVSTANAILHAGATPVFVDIDPETLNINCDEVKRRITRRTKVILPVHYAGLPCPMEELEPIAKARRLRLVEDASHALGASINNRTIGTISDLTCFSFHPSKNITSAEGGMITTADKGLAARLRALRFHGFAEDFLTRSKRGTLRSAGTKFLGFKYVMTDLQASIGLRQLDRFRRFQERRTALAFAYNLEFQDVPEIQCPPGRPDSISGWHLYPIRLRLQSLKCSRDVFLAAMRREHIFPAVHYLPVPLHPYYRKRFGFRKGDFPQAEKAYRELLTLPLFPQMSDRDLQDVVTAVKRLIRYFGRSKDCKTKPL